MTTSDADIVRAALETMRDSGSRPWDHDTAVEALAALAVVEADQQRAYAKGYDDAEEAIWDGPVCTVCGDNHDRDESAMCEGGEVITFREWVDLARAALGREGEAPPDCDCSGGCPPRTSCDYCRREGEAAEEQGA